MTDTPETNQALAEILERDGELSEDNAPAVLVKLCRKFERERNDARDTKWAREIHSCHNACARPICTLKRERDEWKEKADTLLQALVATQDSIGCGCGGDYGFCDQCSKANTEADELIKAWETNQLNP